MEQLPPENRSLSPPATSRTTRSQNGPPSRRVRALLAALAAIALLAVALGQETPMPIEEGPEPFAMEVLVEGLEFPWEVTYGPDDWLWVTERAGARITQ